MVRKKKYTYEEVKYFIEIESNSGCKLISEEYINSKNKLDIRCKCGNTFPKSFEKFKIGQRQCNLCSNKLINEKKKLPFIEVFNFVKNCGYELVSTEYYNNATSIIIKSKEGYLIKTTLMRLKDHKTPNIFHKSNPYTIQNIKLWCKLNNKSFELISKEYIDAHKKLRWLCLESNCGKEFFASWGKIFQNRNCPYCNQSKGEKIIANYLINNNINYTPQKEFESLVGIKNGNLSYDFYLLDYNLLIEYQGEFHDGSAGVYTRRNLKRQKEHDRRKKDYAQNHNIKLFEIWYWDFDNIEEILDGILINK
jgi:hypothetical protein